MDRVGEVSLWRERERVLADIQAGEKMGALSFPWARRGLSYVNYWVLSFNLDLEFHLLQLHDQVSSFVVCRNWYGDVGFCQRLRPFIWQFSLLFFLAFAIFGILSLTL